MKRMQKTVMNCRNLQCAARSVISACVLIAVTAITGCATNKDELLPHGSNTMQDLWKQGTTQLNQQSPLTGRSARTIDNGKIAAENTRFTRSASTEIYSQFTRLPNPDLMMFVYPHLTGPEGVPVPGYSTIFALYDHPQYALPGDSEGEL